VNFNKDAHSRNINTQLFYNVYLDVTTIDSFMLKILQCTVSIKSSRHGNEGTAS